MVDRKILNFEKKINKFNEYHLGKVREASKESPEDVHRLLLRAKKELDSIDKKFEKLKEKFSPDELSDVKEKLEEKRQDFLELETSLKEVEVEESTSEESQAINDSKPSQSKKSIQSAQVSESGKQKETDERIKQIDRALKNFERFQLKDVRKYNNEKDLKAYFNEIHSAKGKLGKIEEKLKQLELEIDSKELSNTTEIFADYQDELVQHENNAKLFQENNEHLKKIVRPFSEIAEYFSYSANEHNDPNSIIDAALNSGVPYTFSDTQILLEVENHAIKSTLKKAKKKYENSLNNLNDQKYIESYFMYLDQWISRVNQKEEALKITYQAVSIIKDTMFPDLEVLDEILFYINKLKTQRKELKEKNLREILISDFHSDNINNVLFTSEETKPIETLTESDMKTEFFPGETIRCIVFLDNSYENIYGKKNRPAFELVGGITRLVTEDFSKEDIDKGYIDFKLVSNGVDYIAPNQPSTPSVERVMKYFADLPPRKKLIEIKIKSKYHLDGKFPAENLKGSFEIDGSDLEGIEILKKNLKIVENQALENETIPEPKMHHPEYEEEILSLFQRQDWIGDAKQVIIFSEDFYALKNKLEITVARGLEIYLLFEEENGCFKQHFILAQDPIGQNWSKFRIEARGHRTQISCDKI